MCVKGVGESLKPRLGKGIDGLMQDMWADERTDSRSHSGLHKRILAEDKNTDWRLSVQSWKCWVISFPCLLSWRFYYKSLKSNQNSLSACVFVCDRFSGLDGITHPSAVTSLERRQWRKSPTHSGMQTVLKGVKMHCAALKVKKKKATWSLTHLCPFPPLISLIHTHHLNMEVRAMIKLSHSANRVARQMLEQRLTFTPHSPSDRFVTLSLQFLVDVLSVLELDHPIVIYLPLVTSFTSGYYSNSMATDVWALRPNSLLEQWLVLVQPVAPLCVCFWFLFYTHQC